MKIVDILNDLVSDCKVSRAEARIKSEVVKELEKLRLELKYGYTGDTDEENLKKLHFNAGIEACLKRLREI